MVANEIQQLQDAATERAAAAFVEANKYIGVDNHADVFNQGRGQAYREFAKYLAELRPTV